MAILAELEELSSRDPDGSRWRGCHREVIDAAGTARTLLPAESGALCIFGTAAGQDYTLPPPVAGMWFEFIVTVTGTGTYNVKTDASTTFIIGGIDSSSTTVAEGGDTFVADGTTHITLALDLDTTLRLVGGIFKFTAISATQWAISGTGMGVGVLATPFNA